MLLVEAWFTDGLPLLPHDHSSAVLQDWALNLLGEVNRGREKCVPEKWRRKER